MVRHVRQAEWRRTNFIRWFEEWYLLDEDKPRRHREFDLGTYLKKTDQAKYGEKILEFASDVRKHIIENGTSKSVAIYGCSPEHEITIDPSDISIQNIRAPRKMP